MALAFELPGIIKTARIVKVCFNALEELDWKAPYFRLKRRSSSLSEILSIFPAR
jgi:hypothetical protein